MHFLNPSAFWAFALLLIPLFIHLFNLRRVKRVYFSNLVFLKNVDHQTKSRSNLKKLVILSLRILGFVFLIFAFARPVFSGRDSEVTFGSQVIYLDNSYSMQQVDVSGEPLLYVADAVVGSVVESIKGVGNVVRYIDNDKSVLLGGDIDRVALGMEFSASSHSAGDLLSKARIYHPDAIHLFSDMQRVTNMTVWEEMLEDTACHYTIHQLISSTKGNIYVDSAYINGTLGLTQENSLTLVVRNVAELAVENLLVKVERNGQQYSSYLVDLPPNGSGDVIVNLGDRDAAFGDYRIIIEDSPVVFDNEFFFRVEALNKASVVVLGEKNSKVGSYFTKVFSNANYFRISTEDIDNVSYESLLGADLIVLAGLKSIPSWFESQYDQMRGRVLIVPEKVIDLASYQSVLQLSLAEKKEYSRSSVDEKSLDHPFFRGVFKRKSDNMSLPEVSSRYKVSGFYESILAANDGSDFLVKSGRTPIYFLTTPLNDSLTNFHKHSLFVPVMYRLAQSSNNSRLFFRMDGSAIRLSADSIINQEVLELTGENETLIPSYFFQDGNIVLQLPEVLDQPGFYNLISDDDTLQRIAVNYSKKESEIEAYSPQEIRQIVNGYDHISYEEIDSGGSLTVDRTKESKSDSLWKYALILALIFLVTESVLLRFTS